jgi:CBS domain-containing protein/ribosome-associated translation inhibitor RaiA
MEIKHTLVLDGSDSLSKALSQLDETPAVIVTKEGKYIGIIDHHSVSLGIRNPDTVRCETVVKKPPVLLANAGVMERVDAFLGGHYKALPVLDEDKAPIGITTRVELLKELLVDDSVPHVNVVEVMNSPVFMIDEKETLSAAKSLLKEKDAHRLVATRNGKLIGLISAYDLAAWSARPNLPSGRKDIKHSEPIKVDDMSISSFMRPDMTIVKEEASLDDAVRRMIDKQVSYVIVARDSKPIGVVSALDIFKIYQAKSKVGIPIQVSGLGEDNAAYFDRIQAKFGHVFEKSSASFNIRNCSVHVKENKSVYSVNAYFETDEGHVSLKLERGSLQEAIDEIAMEALEILRKKKDQRKVKPRIVHAH